MALALSGCGSRTDIEHFEAPGPSCQKTSDCVIVPESCCGSCGAATRDDIKVVNRDALLAGNDSCSNVACPACYQDPDPTLVATCNAGRCRIVDLRTDASTACTNDGDCFLRSSACCGCGTTHSVIGVHDAKRIDALVCDTPPIDACDLSCQGTWPAGSRAQCTGGHCTVSF